MLPEKKDADTPKSKDAKNDDEDSSNGPSTPSAELTGTWKGKLVTYQGEARLTLDVKQSGDIHMRVDRQLLTLLNNARFRDGVLRGGFTARVPYDDHRGRDYNVHLELTLRDNKLSGAATCITLPDDWGNSAVTHWAEVERQP